MRNQAAQARAASDLLTDNAPLSPAEARRLSDHPIPAWTEQMTINYLLAHGGSAERDGGAWHLTWPDGTKQGPVIFTARDRLLSTGAAHLTLEEPRIRRLIEELPTMVPGQAIPRVNLSLPDGVQGYWSLWRISLHTTDRQQQCFLPLFAHDDGRIFLPTARAIWEQLLDAVPEPMPHLYGPDAEALYVRLRSLAEGQGRPLYDRLVAEHERRLHSEESKARQSFAARQHAIERIGLPQVLQYRLARLTREQHAWEATAIERRRTTAALEPILILRAEGG